VFLLKGELFMLRRESEGFATEVSILRTIILLSCAIFAGIIEHASICQAELRGAAVHKGRLIVLAAARFPNLSSAERAMLWYSDIDNVDRGEFAVGGTSSTITDPSNDPAHADQWPDSRQIRALLIRWLCVDHEVLGLIDPKGIRVMGARIIGGLDLSLVSVPIPVALQNCRFTEVINLVGTEIPDLELDGSYTAEIHASG
jgi:hypothetical protein